MKCSKSKTNIIDSGSSLRATAVSDISRVGDSLLVKKIDGSTKLVSLATCCDTDKKTINFVNATGLIPVATVLIP